MRLESIRCKWRLRKTGKSRIHKWFGAAWYVSRAQYYGEEKIMKLNLLFVVMDLFTLLAYPFVFMHARLRQFLKSKKYIGYQPVTRDR